MRFPLQYPPSRPRLFTVLFASTVAFASRSRWTTESWPLAGLRSAAVFCLGSPQSGGQATGRTQRNEGEKNLWEKISGASKVEVLEILATQKSSLKFRNIVIINEMFWWHRVGWKSHVNQVGSQNALRKLKKCSISKRTNMHVIGTQQNLKSVPCSRYFV